MAICIRGNLYSSWKEAEPHIAIYRQENQKFTEFIESAANGDRHTRYHLVLGYGDPWSHRILLALALKQFNNTIPITIVNPTPSSRGWAFLESTIATQGLAGCQYVYELYLSNNIQYTGRITVPLLWDHQTQKVVNNESYDIMKMIDAGFSKQTEDTLTLFPENQQQALAEICDFIFDNINNGVYKVGFASTQKIYDRFIKALFSALDELEERLSTSRFLLGDQITAADICLFASLIRFDTIYHPYLRCNQKRLQDYRNLWLYTKDIYHQTGVRETVRPNIMMQTYYGLNYLNPTGVVPNPPDIDFGDGIEILEYEHYSAPI